MTDLTTGNIYKKFLLFGLPMVFTGLLSQAYNIVDTMIAGRYLGDMGLAAVGATSQVIQFLCAFFWGFDSGFGVYIACLYGSREYSKLRKNVYNITIILSAIEILLCGVMLLFSDGVLDLVNVDATIRKEAKTYFLIYVSGIALIVLNNTFSRVMNALGISAFPFFMSIISGVLNIVGNIISVTVLNIGVAGIALSSVLSATIVDVCYVFKIKSCFKAMNVSGERFNLDFKSFLSSLKFSLPSCLQQMSMYLASATMSPIINAIGSEATAGYSIAMRVYDINATVYQNSANTVSNYGAQCAGARKYEKIKKGLFVGFIQGVLFVTPFILACSLFARQVNGFFFPKGFSGLSLDYATMFSRLYLPFILFNLVNNLFHSFFRGVGAMRLLLLSSVIGSVFRISSGVLLGSIYGLQGVYIGWVISWIGEALFMVLIYLLKFRNTEMIRRAAEKNLR